MKNISLDNYLKKQLASDSFRKEWEKSESQYQLVRALIAARLSGKVSQRELARKAKTTQAVVSRVEQMTMSPSLGLIDRLANALGKKLVIGLR